MRYIPSSRYTLDQIAEQCHAAINRSTQYQQLVSTVDYSEVLHFYRRDDRVLVAR